MQWSDSRKLFQRFENWVIEKWRKLFWWRPKSPYIYNIQFGICKIPINHKFELFGVLWDMGPLNVHYSLSIEGSILQPLFIKHVSYPGNQQMFPVWLENLLGYSILQTILVVVLKCWFCCLVYAVCCTHVQHIYSLYAIPYRVFHILAFFIGLIVFLFVNVCNFVPHCWLCMRELGKSCLLHFQTPFPQLKI